MTVSLRYRLLQISLALVALVAIAGAPTVWPIGQVLPGVPFF